MNVYYSTLMELNNNVIKCKSYLQYEAFDLHHWIVT